jgi:hypothetical protein
MCEDGVDYPRLSWEFVRGGDFSCPDGVAMDDVVRLSQDWLSTYSQAFYGADANGDSGVTFADFAILAAKWLEGVKPPGDFSGDGQVDFVDFAKLSSFWSATCTSPLWCGGADMNKSGLVDWADFEEFAQHWLE